ncbi:MAG: serine protease [Candidatus Saccharimonadales bacterium]
MNEQLTLSETTKSDMNTREWWVQERLHQERLYRRTRNMIIGCFAVAGFVTIGIFRNSVANALGCDNCKILTKEPEPLPYCYTEDEFNEMHKNDDIALDLDDKKTIELKLSPENNQLDSIPNDEPVYAKIAKGSTVKVDTSDGSGTGFVIEDKRHNKVVATAAHVVLGDKNDIRVITADNKKLKVDAGCIIHEDSKNDTEVKIRYNHVASDENDLKVEPFDIAILKVEKSEELPSPLPLANTVVIRGDTLYVNNYQVKENGRDAKINEPSSFYMIAGDMEVGNIETIDGLEVRDSVSGDYARDRTMAGGSGGPAFNVRGEVVGLAYGAEDLNLYMNVEDIKSRDNIIMNERDNLLVKPSHSVYSDVNMIKQALESPTLYR